MLRLLPLASCLPRYLWRRVALDSYPLTSDADWNLESIWIGEDENLSFKTTKK